MDVNPDIYCCYACYYYKPKELSSDDFHDDDDDDEFFCSSYSAHECIYGGIPYEYCCEACAFGYPCRVQEANKFINEIKKSGPVFVDYEFVGALKGLLNDAYMPLDFFTITKVHIIVYEVEFDVSDLVGFTMGKTKYTYKDGKIPLANYPMVNCGKIKVKTQQCDLPSCLPPHILKELYRKSVPRTKKEITLYPTLSIPVQMYRIDIKQ